MQRARELTVEDLSRRVNPAELDFESTDDLTDLPDVIGQPRAVQAVRFGTKIRHAGYNIFAVGSPGMGRRALIRQFFEQQAAQESPPPDWCYVQNFEHPHKPKILVLPAGRGVEFAGDVEELLEQLQTALSSAFESEDFQTRRQDVQEEFQNRQEEALEALRQSATGEGLELLRTPAGLVFAPVKEGRVLSPEEFQQLPEEERKTLESKVDELQEELQKTLNQLPRWQREMQDRLRDLRREVANLSIGGLFSDLREKYDSFPPVVEHLKAVEEDVIENVRDFFPHDESQSEATPLLAMLASGKASKQQPALRRYQVNVLIEHRDIEAAPVILEDNPTYENLIGRVEYLPQLGAFVTDFNMIKPGAFHRANGGFLILDARKVLLQPFAWEGLKRVLESGVIRIETPAQAYGLLSAVTLEPEPIEVSVKVALLGDALLYYTLSELDPEFSQLFKVMADFDERMDRDADNQRLYVRFVATLIHEAGLRPFDRGAVARVIEHSARLVGDSEKLSARVQDIEDVLHESDYWAGEAGNARVQAEDVQKAIEAQIYRSDRMRERLREAVMRETLLIDTDGEKIGQINGLSVTELGEFAFGSPSRITAQVRLGRGEVVDIEREVDLSGPIHSKGVLILGGFLGARYALERPLSLSASLVFEQSYGGVDGDSASSAELYALLSAIGEIPIKQSLAVTGSVSQHGQVQAIGGVNEKIEGFFELCRARGLTGEQGVVIPASNVKNLMLHQDVVEAVGAGQFHVYPVESVDEGIELLTGLEAGDPDEGGVYPEGSVNGKVQRRLAELAERRMEFSAAETEKEEE